MLPSSTHAWMPTTYAFPHIAFLTTEKYILATSGAVGQQSPKQYRLLLFDGPTETGL